MYFQIVQNSKWGWSIAIVVILAVYGAVADAQQPKMIPRIGFLMPGSRSTYAVRIEAFQNGLRELGYFEGQNITIEWRFAEGKSNRLPELAANLVQSKMDVIVTSTTPVAEAARQASRTIPIVMAASADPVGTGLIASLAHPWGQHHGFVYARPRVGRKSFGTAPGGLPQGYARSIPLGSQ